MQTRLQFVSDGDTLVVTRVNRLARSVLQDIVHELRGKGVALRATEQPIDTGPPAGKAFLDMGAVRFLMQPKRNAGGRNPSP